MNRFSRQKNSFSLFRRFFPSVLLFLICVFFLTRGTESIQDTSTHSQLDSLNQALRRSIIHCYAVEGAYPESLDYIREHYGVSWDETKYLVDYEINGANLMPDIKVFLRSGKEEIQ